MQGDDTSGAQDGLAQPAQAEQQRQGPHHRLEQRKRNACQRRAEHRDGREQDKQRHEAAAKRAAPTTGAANGEDHRERLDEFDERGEEGGEDGGNRVAPADDHDALRPTYSAARRPSHSSTSMRGRSKRSVVRAYQPRPCMRADQVELRRVDIAFDRIEHAIVAHVHGDDLAHHHRAVDPHLDDHQTLAFHRDRALGDARRFDTRRGQRREAGLAELVDLGAELDRGDVHRLGARVVDQVDHEIASAADDVASVLRVARRAAADAEADDRRLAGHGVEERERRRVEVLGTVVSLVVAHHRVPPGHGAGVEAVLDAAAAGLHRAGATFAGCRPGSEISRLGRGELALERCSADVADVLAACERAGAMTDGAFSARRGGAVDPGGLVVGWALQRAAAVLGRAGFPDHAVGAEGDVVCAGLGSPGRRWQIGVGDPLRSGVLLTVVEVGDGAVATSGPGARGARVVDPRTGAPASGLAAATVVGPDLAVADALATAALAEGRADAPWMRALVGYEVLTVDAAGRRWGTPGLARHLARADTG